jgi:hypothetical protein
MYWSDIDFLVTYDIYIDFNVLDNEYKTDSSELNSHSYIYSI